jgi:hypothetical protein
MARHCHLAKICSHKVHIHVYTEYHSVCPLVGIGTPIHPFSRYRACPSPLYQGGGGAQSATGEGVVKSQFRRLEKKLSTLPTLCLQSSSNTPPPLHYLSPFFSFHWRHGTELTILRCCAKCLYPLLYCYKGGHVSGFFNYRVSRNYPCKCSHLRIITRNYKGSKCTQKFEITTLRYA